MTSDNRLLKRTLWISITFYTLSLFFSGFSTAGSQKNEEIGILLVLFGWMDVFGRGAGYVWLANPVIWVAFSTIRKPKKSLVFGLIAFAFMIIFACSKSVTHTGWCGSWLETADCPQVVITNLNLGYYLWLGSAVTLLSGNLVRIFSNKK